MAPGRSGNALGFVNCNGHREITRLKLGAEHVPFPCSLRELVLDRYGEPPGTGGNEHPMQIGELLEYLRKIDNFSLSPWVAITGQTEAIGDPATPSREQVAILRWLGKALEIWEKQFPLEGRLAAQVRRLKPLSAALALVDPRFMQPGAHPLHHLLDNFQARAIGWQSRLDRVGVVLEQQVIRAVDESRKWFEDQSVDLEGICSEFTVAADRDQARAQRMVQRVVEAEAGKVKTAAAKQEAARMINAALERFAASEEIGGFIKGPWYTSAQLLLLKFGADSDQWRMMSSTTETLLDSLQNVDDVSDARRQHIFEVVTQLPKEMRRWLLSLHHDTEAVNEAMGLVEFAHLKILRRQPLDLQRIPPILVEGEHTITSDRQTQGAIKNWQEGQWFSVDTAEDGILRMQLVLKVDQSQQLLFTNLAGIKVLQLSFDEFTRLLEKEKVKALYSGASFSLCLAYAVGIDSVEILDALVSALAETDSVADPDSVSPARQPVSGSESTQKSAPEVDPVPQPIAEAETTPAEILPEQEDELQLPQAQIGPEAERASTDRNSAREYQQLARKAAGSSGYLIEQAEQIAAQGGYLIQQEEGYEGMKGFYAQGPADSNTDPGYHADEAAESDTGQRYLSDKGHTEERRVNLPMGAWLGFHDGETPLMARLAVYDTEEDYYIFVNRNGVKMRQISRPELLTLIDKGMVDILEANSNFRDEVSEVRKNLDQ